MHRSILALLLPVSLVAIATLPAGASASGERGAGSAVVRPSSGRAKVLLKLGAMKTEPSLSRLSGALSSASRVALGGLPGFRLLAEGEEVGSAVTKRQAAIVLVTGRLVEVGQVPAGGDVVVTAKVEYFVHRMPGQSIAAVVSGSAKAKVAAIQVKKPKLREKLENDLVAAAVQNAVKRTEPALKAAAD